MPLTRRDAVIDLRPSDRNKQRQFDVRRFDSHCRRATGASGQWALSAQAIISYRCPMKQRGFDNARKSGLAQQAGSVPGIERQKAVRAASLYYSRIVIINGPDFGDRISGEAGTVAPGGRAQHLHTI
jgi:hypothetical protein